MEIIKINVFENKHDIFYSLTFDYFFISLFLIFFYQCKIIIFILFIYFKFYF